MEEKRRGGGDRRGEIGEGEKEREKCTYPASQISHGQEPPPPDWPCWVSHVFLKQALLVVPFNFCVLILS